MAIDPYSYPDSDVPQNMLGIRNASELDAVIQSCADHAINRLPNGAGDTSHESFMALHEALFGHLFPWAGTLRTTNLGEGNKAYAHVDVIAASLAARFAQYQKYDALGQHDAHGFFDNLALHISELHAIAPFRAGNSALIKVHAGILARIACHKIAWDALTWPRWQQLLDECLTTLDHDPLRGALQGQVYDEDALPNARIGVGGLAFPPLRAPPAGKHYLIPLPKVKAELRQYYGLDRPGVKLER